MKNLFLLLILSFSLNLPAHATPTEDPPWLVRITSEFMDQANGNTLMVEGSGSVVAIDNTCLVLTASHVSEGSDLKIYSQNKRLEIFVEKKVVDVDNDLALIPLKNCDVKPLAFWDEDYKGTGAGFFVVPKSTTKIWMEKCSFLCDSSLNLVQVSGGGALVPKGSWVNLETSDWTWKPLNNNKFLIENSFQKVHGGAHLSIDNQEVTTTGKIVPGMSGAPLITRAPKYGATLHVGGQGGQYSYQVGSVTEARAEEGLISGVGNRFLRYFDRAYFSSPSIITNLVESFQGKRNRKPNDSSWKLRNCLQYRESPEAVLEINPLSNPTGNGISGGPGNGISGGPGSNSCTPQQKFGTSSATESWKIWQISYGLGTKSGPGVIAYRLNSKNPSAGRGSEYIEANWSSYRLKKALQEKYEVQEIRFDENLWPLFESRFIQQNRYASLGIQKSTECQLKLGKTNYGQLVQVNLRIPRTDVPSGIELISFSLDEYGRDILNNRSAHYTPIIETQGLKSETLYHIDIRGLFYTDRTMLTKESLLGPAEYIWNKTIEPSLYIKQAGKIDSALFCTYEP